MNVSVVQVQTPKTQMYLYWVRVTKRQLLIGAAAFLYGRRHRSNLAAFT